MGLRSYFGFGAGRDVEDRALTSQNVPPSLLPYSSTVGSVTPATAPQVADAYACIRCLADAASSIPLHVFRATSAGRERVEHGRTPALLDNPAPGMTQAALVGQIVAHLNLHGNAYIGLFRDGAGAVAQLALLHPDRVVPEIRAGRPVYTVMSADGRRTVHTADDIVHVKALTTDGLVGLSPVRQARTVLGLSDSLAKHAGAFFENGARPAGILRVNTFGQPAVATEDGTSDLDQLRSAFNSEHQGTGNAHKVAIVSGEVEYQQLSMSLDDAQFLQQRQLSAVEVARVFRVPPHMIGAPTGESMTYSNVEQQALEFVTFSLRPQLVLIEQALSAHPALFATRTFCSFVLEALLRADHATRATFYTAALDPISGWLTRGEVRAMENLPPETVPDAPAPAPAELLNGVEQSVEEPA